MSRQTLQGTPTERPIAQLIYSSISTAPVNGALEISDILEEARDKNRASDVTGVLTVVDGRFIQVLEGDDAVLDELLASLDADPRHTEMRVFERRHVERRAFAEWDMVSPRLTRAGLRNLAGLMDTGETRLDAYLPVLVSALAAQDRATAEWNSPDRNGEQA